MVPTPLTPLPLTPARAMRAPVTAVAIGGSAGAVLALDRILPRLPPTFPPVFVVVHVTPSSPSLLPELFSGKCAMKVREATSFATIEPGHVYFAPADYHFLIEPDGRCSLSIDPPVLFSRPAIDVLFESAAAAYGAGLAGVVLTGGSADGATGLRRVHEAGGQAFVQDPATAEVDVMPRSALESTPAARILALEAIAEHLISLVGAP